MSGCTVASSYASADFGTLRVPAPTNLPPPRYLAAVAFDSATNAIFVFGGFQTVGGVMYTGAGTFLGDCWRFSLNDYLWTWSVRELQLEACSIPHCSAGSPL
jgi:hypothetical protein